MSYNLKTLAKIWRDGNNRGNKIGITALGKYGNYSIPVPPGLIVPFNDTTVPDGWTRFSSADDKMIVGAGSTYAVDGTGGSTSVSLSETTGSGGAHTSSTTFIVYGAQEYTYIAYYQPTPSYSAGAHSHDITGGSYSPECNNLLLIKSNEQHTSLPAKAVLMSAGDMATSGLSIFNDNDKFLKSNSTVSQDGASTIDLTLSSAGSHYHAPSLSFSDACSGAWYSTYASGSHTPTGTTANVTPNLTRFYLSAWTNASQNFGLRGSCIAMYESLTPPDGWLLCDGTNGTPDLRDCFIGYTQNGNESSSKTGNNTINIATTDPATHSASHQHSHNTGLFRTVCMNNYQHSTYSWSHSHSMSINTNVAYLPPYYSLAFIMQG